MPRVEHAQLVAADGCPRFAALGIAASMQPVHVRSDAAKAAPPVGRPRGRPRLCPRRRSTATGAVIAFGTDAPVEPVDPWPGLACAVTRASPEWPAGDAPLGAGQRARRCGGRSGRPAWTRRSRAGEPDRGRLVPGQRADLVVIPAAAVTEPVEVGGALWHARPRLVLLDGEVAAER